VKLSFEYGEHGVSGVFGTFGDSKVQESLSYFLSFTMQEEEPLVKEPNESFIGSLNNKVDDK
jgi:hypothetical protein